MKKLFKTAAILVAAAVMITAGVFAAVNNNRYEWNPTAHISFNAGLFATVSEIGWAKGTVDLTDRDFTASAVVGDFGNYNDAVATSFKTYDDANGNTPKASADLTAWTIGEETNPVELDSDLNALRMTFKVTNDADTAMKVTLTYVSGSRATASVYAMQHATDVADDTGATNTAKVISDKVEVGSIAKDGSAVFTIFIVVEDMMISFNSTPYAFKVDMEKAN